MLWKWYGKNSSFSIQVKVWNAAGFWVHRWHTYTHKTSYRKFARLLNVFLFKCSSCLWQSQKIYRRWMQMAWVSPGCNPAGKYVFKVNNRNTRTRCEICSKITIKKPERRQQRPYLQHPFTRTRSYSKLFNWWLSISLNSLFHGREYQSCSSNSEVIFNNLLRSARNQVECSFRRLKTRWDF